MKNRKTLLQNVVIFLPFVHLLIINIYQITQDEFYFLSAEVFNSGGLDIDGRILTWFVDDYFSPDYINAVGAFGEAYSSWGSNLVDQATPYDDGYSESRDCVK